jgi:superfamily II DNA or RNA helicase
MGYSFHAVFNEELESVSVFVHVEVACINFGYDMLDIECSIKLGGFFQLKNYFLQVIVRRKNSHDTDRD